MNERAGLQAGARRAWLPVAAAFIAGALAGAFVVAMTFKGDGGPERITVEQMNLLGSSRGFGPLYDKYVDEESLKAFEDLRAERGDLSEGEESSLLAEARVKTIRIKAIGNRVARMAIKINAPEDAGEAVLGKGIDAALNGYEIKDSHILAWFKEAMGK